MAWQDLLLNLAESRDLLFPNVRDISPKNAASIRDNILSSIQRAKNVDWEQVSKMEVPTRPVQDHRNEDSAIQMFYRREKSLRGQRFSEQDSKSNSLLQDVERGRLADKVAYDEALDKHAKLTKDIEQFRSVANRVLSGDKDLKCLILNYALQSSRFEEVYGSVKFNSDDLHLSCEISLTESPLMKTQTDGVGATFGRPRLRRQQNKFLLEAVSIAILFVGLTSSKLALESRLLVDIIAPKNHQYYNVTHPIRIASVLFDVNDWGDIPNKEIAGSRLISSFHRNVRFSPRGGFKEVDRFSL